MIIRWWRQTDRNSENSVEISCCFSVVPSCQIGHATSWRCHCPVHKTWPITALARRPPWNNGCVVPNLIPGVKRGQTGSDLKGWLPPFGPSPRLCLAIGETLAHWWTGQHRIMHDLCRTGRWRELYENKSSTNPADRLADSGLRMP